MLPLPRKRGIPISESKRGSFRDAAPKRPRRLHLGRGVTAEPGRTWCPLPTWLGKENGPQVAHVSPSLHLCCLGFCCFLAVQTWGRCLPSLSLNSFIQN